MLSKAKKQQPEQQFHPEVEYRQIIEALRAVTTIVLFEFARDQVSKRDLIIRNFIARAQVTLESLLRLYEGKAYGDCWTLFRTIVDRLFHLHVLAEDDEFAAFEEWSFVKQYEIINNIGADTSLTPEQKAAPTKPTPEQKKRYKELKDKGITWREPKAEDAAKSLGMPFLYKYAYDHASRFLHPLATDGKHEFEYLTQLGEKGERGDQRVLLHNAVLAYTILLHEALNVSDRDWRNLIYDCVEAFRQALTGERLAYRERLARITAAGPDTEWSRQKKSPGG
jgi:hypothetical protein